MAETDTPYLRFADISLDISRGNYSAARQKLEVLEPLMPESYHLNLLYARALAGMERYAQACKYLQACCTLAPANEVAWYELATMQALAENDTSNAMESSSAYDPVVDELEQLSAALMKAGPILASDSSEPTSIAEQKQPFADDTEIAVPTESLATLFIAQGAYKKAIRMYSHLIQLKPNNARFYQDEIDRLLDRL
uniref:Uncharacterized protein n=1 Tax=Chlorobium chlorochromatii (strain CaD3) TaxID=340177 RepID=Q3AS56_CHLCH